MSVNIDNADTMDVGGAWGAGWDYWSLNKQQKKEFVANKLATNQSTLERDEYETLSDRMITVYQDELVGIQDLQNAGLTRNISLATQVDLWQTQSEFTDAEVTMDGEAQSGNDRIQYETEGVPVPIYHKDFRVAERELQTSRNMNNDLRTDGVARATRKVAEMMEQVLFQGWSPNVSTERGDSFELYGYTNHPDRNTVSGADWGTAGNIRDNVVDAIDALDEDNQTPSGDGYWMYVSEEQWRQLRSAIDPDGDGNLTVRERLENEFSDEIGAIRRVGNESLPDGEAVLVNPNPEVVELAVAEDIQTVEWTSGSGFTNYFKVLSAMAPEIKSDQDGNSGVTHLTGI